MSFFIADLLLAAASLPALGAAAYLGALALLARRAPAPAPATPPLPRFDIVVPAHDEEPVVAATVASLLATAYPADHRRVHVVADNCTDGTAQKAAAAGARVLVRVDPTRRGKGFALAFAFERLLAEGWSDALVIVDADTLVAPNLLAASAVRLAHGEQALQAEYGVRNAQASWRTRLMRLAFTLFHDVRSLARERLGLSCGLRGNGMVFTAALLRRVPHDAFSIVEDLEYGLRLGRAGVRVAYVAEAQVAGEMAVSEQASRSQRRRWEGGRWLIARQQVPSLLAAAWRTRSRVLLDLALDLLVPPLGWLALVIAAGLGTCALLMWRQIPLVLAPLTWGLAALAVGLYVARGLLLSGLGWRGVGALAWAPVYVLWKVVLLARRPAERAGEWVRTTREGHS